jgi:hypothetical protein
MPPAPIWEANNRQLVAGAWTLALTAALLDDGAGNAHVRFTVAGAVLEVNWPGSLDG